MKTQPMKQQIVGRKFLDERPKFAALACEQGTGKTWMLLDDMERRFKEGLLNAALVVAPKGVHTNWVLREMPTHMEIDHVAFAYSSGLSMRRKRALERFLKLEHPFKVLAMNIDSLNTATGYAVAKQFLTSHESSMVIDESSRIKNPSAARTKKAIALGRLAVSRRIASGTMITNGPPDIFSQFDFLREGLLGTRSYRAFVAEFSELLSSHDPRVQHAKQRSAAKRGGAGFEPQMIKKDSNGMPVWRNLDRLANLMAPHMYRVLKSECLDLPDKIYQTAWFDLSPNQMKVYRQMDDEFRFERDTGEVDVFTSLARIQKLQQITSGFVLIDGEPANLAESAGRMTALETALEDVVGKAIVWAVYRQELAMIAKRLRELGYVVVEYHGGINSADREAAINEFQDGDATIFLGQAQAGGTGLTLTAAETAIYYSCNYDLDLRLQSEDRCHRIGTKKNVVYIDIVATGTIDERIASVLQAKEMIATTIQRRVSDLFNENEARGGDFE